MAEIENTGIIDELLAEIKEKNRELSKFKSGNKSIVYFSSPFEVSSEDPLEVRGIFLTEGMWNNDFYSNDIVKSIEKQVKTREIPVLVEHGKTDLFGSKPVGKTTIGEYNDIIKGTLGRVEITDPKARRLVQEKKLKGFSVRGEVDKRPQKDGSNTIESFNLFEISMVEDPACDISVVAFSKDLLNKLKEKPKEGNLMAKETVPVEREVEIDLKKGQVIALLVMDEEEAKEKKYPYSYGEPGKEKYEYPKKKERVAKSLEELSEIVDTIAARIDEIEKKIGEKEEEEEKPEKEEDEDKLKCKYPKEEETAEEDSGPRSEEQRAKAHFKITDEDWDKLTDEKKKELIDKLPPRGSEEKKEAQLEAEKKTETPAEKPPEVKEEKPPVATTEKPPEVKTETPIAPVAPAPSPAAVPAPQPASTPTPTLTPVPEAPQPEAKVDVKKLEEELSPGEALLLQKKILKEPE